MVEQLYKTLLPSCQLRFSSLYIYTHKLVEIITKTIVTNFPNPSNSWGPTQNLAENVPQSTRLAAIPASVAPQNQTLYALHNVSPTSETFSHPNAPHSTTLDNVYPTPEPACPFNTPYLTTLVVTPARATPWDQLPYASPNILPTLKTFSFPNMHYLITPGDVCPIPEIASLLNMPYSTTLASTLARTAPWDQFPYIPRNIFPISETFSSPNIPYLITPAITLVRAVP